MPKLFNVDDVVSEIKGSLSDMLKKDVASIQGFAEDQLRMLAERGERIATRLASGAISADRAKELSADLEGDTKTLAEVLAGLIALEIEKVWNAIVNAIWGAINAAIDGAITAALPIPKLPARPGGN